MSSNGNGIMPDNTIPPFQVLTARAMGVRNAKDLKSSPPNESAECKVGHKAMEATIHALRVDNIAAEASIEILHDNVFKLRQEKIETQDTILSMANEIRQLKHFKKLILEKARLMAPHSEDMIKAVSEGTSERILEQRAFASAENVGLIRDKVAKEGHAVKATNGAEKPRRAMTLEEEVFGPPISKGDDPELVSVKQMLHEARGLSQNADLCAEEKLSQDKPLPVIEKTHTFRGRMRTLRRRVSQVFVNEN